MPQELFVQAVREAYAEASQIPRRGSFYGEVVEDTIHRVAQLFDVSDFAAKQRAIQLGWDVAAGTHLYINGNRRDPFFFQEGTLGSKQSFVIDETALANVCKNNSTLKELLDSKKFIYLGYVVCINDDEYIREANSYEKSIYGYDYELTDYARNHVDECCLIFDWESISGANDDGGFYGQCYLNKDISSSNRVEHHYNPDFEFNMDTVAIAEEVAKYKAAFADEEKIEKEVPDEFTEALIYHMKRKDVTVEQLSFNSALSQTTIKKYRAGTSKPDIDNMMAIFIV